MSRPFIKRHSQVSIAANYHSNKLSQKLRSRGRELSPRRPLTPGLQFCCFKLAREKVADEWVRLDLNGRVFMRFRAKPGWNDQGRHL